jgi:hypothetical protein
MSFKDYKEFERLVVSKNPVYETYTSTGGDIEIVKSILKEKIKRSSDLFSSHNGIIACNKNGNVFEFKCGDNKVYTWDSVSNIFDSSKEIDLPDEDWSKEYN